MADNKFSYSKSKQALEDIIARMQKDGIEIDESLKLHKDGLRVADELITYINKAEIRVSKLKTDWEKKVSS